MQRFLDNKRSAQWVLALMFGLAAVNWPLLPDEVPIHWSSGDAAPDSLGPKSFGLLFLPVFALVQYLVFRIVPAFGSSDRLTTLGGYRSNGETEDDTDTDGDRYWRWMSTILVVVHLVVYADMLIAFRSLRPHPGAVIGLTLVGLGPLLRSIEPNPLFGIRTPWTMRSDRCWERTHRFALLPTLAVGLALIGSDFLPVDLGWPAIVGAIAIWGGGLTLYSYVQWRKEADR